MLIAQLNLHSSMDRLETIIAYIKSENFYGFTFQYGQIRNEKKIEKDNTNNYIYIPVWIDQKQWVMTK